MSDHDDEIPFGPWLKRRRQALDLTQDELSERVGYATPTIQKIEQGARRPSRELAERLLDALGVPAEERPAALRLARLPAAAEPAPPTPAAALPDQPTSFVGRERELARLAPLLARPDTRIVTLLGPGGAGKTRLARQLAERVAPRFRHGIGWVALATLASADEALEAIARALDVPPDAADLRGLTLAAARPRQLLLVLDNLEHLLAEPHGDLLRDRLAELAQAAPELVLLTTSRERLRLQAEWVVELPGLGLPADDSPPSVAGSDAVQLFVERARRTVGDFALDGQNRPAVAQIYRRLDGLPLAIELAAAQVSFLPAPALLARLDQALSLLEGGARDLPERQRTMRATIGWSYDLLGGPERALFARLAVFVGGFSLEAAEAVGGGGAIGAGQVLRLLGRLVDQSLVLREALGDDGARYRLLEPVRQYALERLEAQPDEAAAARERHAAQFVALAAAASPLLRTGEQVRWVERLEREHPNLGAAMAWLLARGHADRAAAFGRSLWVFLWVRGHFREGRRWMAEALERLSDEQTRPRGDALLTSCVLAYGQADYAQAEPQAAAALEAYSRAGDEWGIAEALSMVGLIAAGLGQAERATEVMEEAVERSLAVGNRWSAAMTLTYWAPILLRQGAHRRAAELAEQALALASALGDRIAVYSARYNLALVARAEGDDGAARQQFAAALALAVEIGDTGNLVACLQGLGGVAAAQGQPVRAARLWGAAAAQLASREAARYTYSLDQELYQRLVAAARAGLDPDAWALAWAEGELMTQEQAVAYALER